MFCFCFLCAFALIFQFKICRFVGGGEKIVFLPGAGYPYYATVWWRAREGLRNLITVPRPSQFSFQQKTFFQIGTQFIFFKFSPIILFLILDASPYSISISYCFCMQIKFCTRFGVTFFPISSPPINLFIIFAIDQKHNMAWLFVNVLEYYNHNKSILVVSS